MKQNLLLTLFLFFGMVNTIAQQDSLVVKYDTDNLEVQQISEEDIKDFRNDPKFNYEVEINEILKKFTHALQKQEFYMSE